MKLLKGYYPTPSTSPPDRGVSDVDYDILQTSGQTSAVPSVKKAVPDPKHSHINRMVSLYNANLDVYRACDIFSSWFADLPLAVIKKTKQDEQVLDPTLDYPLNFLQKGNYRESGYVLKKKLATWYLLARVAYLAFRMDPNGKGIQFEVLDPRRVIRVPGADKQIEAYVYYDASAPESPPVVYPADYVIELVVDGFGQEPYAITTPSAEVYSDASLGQASKSSLLNRARQQAAKIGVIFSDPTSQNAVRESLAKDAKGRSPYIFLDSNDKYEPINLIAKDGIEADLLARGEATKDLFSAMKTPSMFKDLDPEKLRYANQAIAVWLRTDVIPLANMFCAQITARLCVGSKISRSVRVQQSNVLELAPLYVESTRAMVARLNSGATTVAEERESAGLDKVNIPDEVSEFSWVTEATKPVADMYRAKNEQMDQKTGPLGEGTAASTSMPLPGSNGGRDQRREGQMIDETGEK